MQNVLGSLRLRADTTLGKGHVGGYAGVEVVAHHNHIKELGLRIDAVGERRVGR